MSIEELRKRIIDSVVESENEDLLRYVDALVNGQTEFPPQIIKLAKEARYADQSHVERGLKASDIIAKYGKA